ncbi:pyridoxal phosphate-dependent aminotransferase [Oceanobacillus massiliensis]|uniref:pyridoxal phosphate-dependent aminotransferase n=1 Tax=Oceanobacillus massiliensis TaxID=1465765 RepID=UPI00301B35F3
MTNISNRISQIPFSSIREIFEEATEMEMNGDAITHMEIGRPDFDTPDHIKEAAIKALKDGHVHYTPNRGIQELTEAIADKLKKENHVTINPEDGVVVSVGCKEAITNTIFAFINPGDEVLVPDPSWLEYQYIVRLAGGIPIPMTLKEEEGFLLNIDDIRNKLSPKTKMMLINSPHNPTGSVLPEENLREIAQVAMDHDLLVLSDEIYEKLIYDDARHVSIASLPGMFERTIVINGFSKAYAMDGWRLGYAAGPRSLIQSVLKMHQYNTSSATSFAQYGAVEAYNGTQEPVGEMVRAFDLRRKLLIDRLSAMPNVSCVVPKGAFYVFPSFRGINMTSKDLAKKILREAHIACVPGSAFGNAGEGYIRMAYSSGYEQIEQAMDRLEKVIKDIFSKAV